MFPVRYIHAADLHLDVSFKGLRRQHGLEHSQLDEVLTNATFTALERLVVLCEREKPDFLVLAGDIYNEEDHSLKAQLALRDACVRLQQSRIAVFIVHGNHDPISTRLKTIKWPDNTTIFDAEGSYQLVMHKSRQVPMAVVHGISHNSPKESRNLAKTFSRLRGEHKDLFQLGLLHCALDNVPPADRYAPCSVNDLESTGLDAFALGHVHEGRIVQEKPFIAYSGSTQGLHINEQGIKGCYLVEVNPQEHGMPFSISSNFHPLGPVLWEKCDIAIDSLELIDEVVERIQEALEDVAANCPIHCQAVIVRINLTGHTILDGPLRHNDFCEEFVSRLQNQDDSNQLSKHCIIWVKDIVLETSPILDLDEMSRRDDLLGETLRLGFNLVQDKLTAQDFVQNALQPLFASARLKHIIQSPEIEDSQELVEIAQRICADIMEKH